MKKLKKFLAGLLSIIMLTAILPMNVLANNDSNVIKELPSSWPSFRGNDTNNAVISSKTPKNADEATLYWAVKMGAGYGSKAIGSPIIVEDNIVFCSGTNLYKMNRYTGEILEQTGEMVGQSNFNIVPPLYAEGMIFVGLANGTIQAFDAETLESLWVYKDALKGQPNSPIICKDGYIYTGFWNSETRDANFVCVSVTDEYKNDSAETKLPTWTYTQKGGFYWSGAYVSDKFLLVGTDDGESGYLSDTSSLLSLDPKTGTVIDIIENLNGDIRSSVTFDEVTNRYYFDTKGGSFYSAAVNEDGTFKTDKNGVQGYDLKEIVLTNGSGNESSPAMSTSTPVVYNGRAYIGVSGTSQFSQYSGHNITVIDLENWKIAYTVATKGYPQTSGLLTTAYEDSDGYAYIYFIDNYTPGQVRVIKDKPGVTSVVDGVTETYTNRGETYTCENCAPVLFTPSGTQAQYAICSPIADEEGTLYFKNDSAHMMALGSKIKSIEITSQPEKTIYAEGESFNPDGMKVVAHLANGIDRDVTKYVSFSDATLTKENTDVTIYYNYVMYGDRFDAVNGNEPNVTVDPLETYAEITVLTEDEKDSLTKAIDLIDAIGNVTLESEQAIENARNAYDELSEQLKELVDNYDVLNKAEAELAGLKGEIKTIEDLIDAIGEVTFESKTAISAARAGYDALDDELKTAVSNYSALIEAEETLEAIEAEIQKVTELIDSIGEVALKSEETITEVRKAYDALPEESKVGIANAEILVKAEETLKELKDGIEKVISLINDIGEVIIEKESDIKAAKAAYNALNEEQKQQVENFDLLLAAEEKLEELKAEQKHDDSSTSEIDSTPDSSSNLDSNSTESKTPDSKSDSKSSASSSVSDASPNTGITSYNNIIIVIILLSLGIIAFTQVKNRKIKD